MRLIVKDKHKGEGLFPLFKKGTKVNNIETCESLHWFSCEIEGHKTYIPDIYLTENLLNQDYDPTELILEKNQVITLIEVVYEWLYVQNEEGKKGWLPSEKAISVSG
ncbi:MAG: SH3 domain-containing protein [Erysipelotrichales bacterium]|nr:SH3 domain-containing protein [Erysipelotrichales bacterium]